MTYIEQGIRSPQQNVGIWQAEFGAPVALSGTIVRQIVPKIPEKTKQLSNRGKSTEPNDELGR